MKFIFIFLIILLFTNQLSHADSFQDAYQKGLVIGKQNQGIANSAIHADPKSLYKDYNDQPKEKNYYKDNLKSDENLKNSTNYEFNQNSLAQKINNDKKSRPEFIIDKNSRSMNMNQWILNNGYELTHEKSCKEIPSCVTTYENLICFEKPQAISHSCNQRLVITVEPIVDEKHYPILVYLSSGKYYMAALIDLTNGYVIDHGPRNSSASIQGVLPPNIDCSHLSSVISSMNLNSNLVRIRFPSCSSLTLDLEIQHPSRNGRASGSILIDNMVRRVDYKVNEYWTNDCAIYDNNTQCSLIEDNCIEGFATKIIGGLSFTRSCWAKQQKYLCTFTSQVEDTCKPLRDKGCEQIGSECVEWQENQCILFKQTMRCANKDCTFQKLCTDIPPCIDGNCSSHVKTNDPDFSQAVGSLASVFNAAKDMDKNTKSIFSGVAMSCSTAPVGFLNCCGKGGWGEILNNKCDQAEKDLQYFKEKHLTIRIPGKYCAKKTAGICTSYRQRYCKFQNKIARLIQEEGRLAQLKRDFGSPEDPNCNGIVPEDLQKIDFSKIDFSEIAEDLKNSFPVVDEAAWGDRMNKKVQENVSKKPSKKGEY